MKKLKLIVLLLSILSLCQCSDMETPLVATSNAVIDLELEEQTAHFTIQCINENTIRVTALGNIPNIPPPVIRPYNLTLMEMFKPDMLGQDAGTGIQSVIGHFINTEPGEEGFTVQVGGENINMLATTAGGSSYGLNFVAVPNTPGLIKGGTISGFVDIVLTMPPELNLGDILQECLSTGDVYWGTPNGSIIGDYIILCPCPYCEEE